MSKPEETAESKSIIDMGDEEIFFQLSTEDLEAQKITELRKTIVQPLIDTIFPNKTLEQQYEETAQKLQKPVDYLDEKERASIQLFRNRYYKQNLIHIITHKEIADQDLAEYITALHNFSASILPLQTQLTPGDMNQWVSTCDTADQAKFNQILATQWKTRFMTGIDEQTAQQRLRDFTKLLVDITESNRYPRPKPKNPEVMMNHFNASLEFFEYYYLITAQREKDELDRKFLIGANRLGLIFNDPEQTRLMLQVYKETANYPDRDTGTKFAEVVSSYASNHGLSAEKTRGLIDRLLPAMQNKNPQVEIILKNGNIWGMKRGDFGVGDYLCHAYASQVSSENLNELLLAAREVPATSLARLEQNRLDGLTMAKPFGILRDLIHDQRPYINNLITAMVHYYDTNDKSQLEKIIPQVDYFISKERIQSLFDKSKYDMEIEERNKDRTKVKSIDILRRLAENTKPIIDTPPITSDEQFNEKLQALNQKNINGSLIDKELLADTINHISQHLSKMIKEKAIGIEPNKVIAISWLEREATELLRNISFEDQQGAYKQNWFISLLRFQELIGSPQYSEQQFQNYIQSLLITDSPLEAYKQIGRHILENIKALAVLYKQKRRTDIGALWSGNLVNELVRLIDLRPAKTEQGKKFRNENIKQIIEPRYHPGD